ncbi:MAG: hypothetical protein IKH28_02750 [Lachnospiraceae bacterium]|nr:hypothetical protein [Lachnospiraceae bacterium]
MKKKKELIFWAVAWLINVKSIFLDYCADSGYTFAMAQRLLNGDRLFREMWEPHQTSVFVMTPILKLFETVFQTRTGVVLFAHVVMTLSFFVLSVFLKKTLEKFTGNNVAICAAILLFILRPKMVQLPDYSNLCIFFSVLTFIFLIRYLLVKPRIGTLIAAALSLCLTVLVYPSCVLLWVPSILVLFLYSAKKWRDVLTFTGCCALCGALFAGYFVLSMGFVPWLETLSKIVHADTHSLERTYSGIAYFEELLLGLLIMGISWAVGLGISFLLEKAKLQSKPKTIFLQCILVTFALCLARVLLPSVYHHQNVAFWAFGNIAIFAVILLGLTGVKLLQDQKKVIYVTGMLLSMGVLLSVGLLTNLSFITIVGYLHLACMVSFIPLSEFITKRSEGQYHAARISCFPLYCCVFVIMFSQGINSLGNAENYVRKGPLFGVVTSLNACNEMKYGIAEWEENIKVTDQVLIIQEFGLDPIWYLVTDFGVGTYSVINTPYYSEDMKEYWKAYPQKEPTVLAVPCYQGLESTGMPKWLYEKRENEYDLKYKGTYWNFYFKK